MRVSHCDISPHDYHAHSSRIWCLCCKEGLPRKTGPQDLDTQDLLEFSWYFPWNSVTGKFREIHSSSFFFFFFKQKDKWQTIDCPSIADAVGTLHISYHSYVQCMLMAPVNLHSRAFSLPVGGAVIWPYWIQNLGMDLPILPTESWQHHSLRAHRVFYLPSWDLA